MIEFLVDSISSKGLVLGRNGDEAIPVGTTFSAVTRSRVYRDKDGIYVEELGEVGRVALTLLEVHWYERSIDHVPIGHTAGLAVMGTGLELLSELLRVLPQHEYLSLIATVGRDGEPVSAPEPTP